MKKLFTKIRSNYKKIILDFIPAFLGVLIALVLSDFKEQRKENEFITKSIISINNDNLTNLENINLQIKHLEMQTDTIKFYIENNDVSIISLLGKNGGLQIESLKLSGWNILQNSTSIIEIDYNFLSLLTKMNESVKTLDSYSKNTFNILYNSMESNSANDKKRVFILIKDYRNASKHFKRYSEELDTVLQLKYGKLLTSQD